MKDRKTSIRIIALAMAMLVASSATVAANAAQLSSNQLAVMQSSLDSDGRVYQTLKTISDKKLSKYSRLTVTVGTKTLSVKGFIANGTVYIPFRAAAGAIPNSKYDYTYSTGTSVMTAPGLEISASNGCYVTYANGRALFNTTPCVILSDGRMYIPVSVFAKAVGMTVTTSGGNIRLTGSFKPLIHADKFYREDEVFWLARIIHAESRGEPLLGQIAVGSVVMNRVKSSYYPNTIYSVIFDRKYGVQFSPILDGSIYNTPGYTSTLAAKICLEGYDVTGGAFFFLAPELATSSWIPQTRKYAFTVGGHDFYF